MAKLIRNKKSSKKEMPYLEGICRRACVKISAEAVASLLGIHSDKIHFIEACNSPRSFLIYHDDNQAPGQVLYDLVLGQHDPHQMVNQKIIINNMVKILTDYGYIITPPKEETSYEQMANTILYGE